MASVATKEAAAARPLKRKRGNDDDNSSDNNDYEYNDEEQDVSNYYESEDSSEDIRKLRKAIQFQREQQEELIQKRRIQRMQQRTRFWRILTRKKQTVGLSSVKCHGMNYEAAFSVLKEREFYNISTKKIDDLPYERLSEEGSVETILINQKSDFDVTSQFPFDANIVIFYHSLKRAEVPMTAFIAKGKNIKDIVKKFTDAGFVVCSAT